ncbi:MAG: GAF and ANTAR domain-containing protein [Pseudonocardiaceae bacterium]
MTGNRESVLAEAFVGLADTLVAGYDVIDLLHRLTEVSVQLLDVDAAGLLLSDQCNNLHMMASSSESSRLLELFQLQNDEGPCLDCFRTGSPVAALDLADAAGRWPRFAAHAQLEGFHSVHALPMRLRTETIGALNLFRDRPGELPAVDLRVGQALADVATIGILQERAVHRGEVLAEQLQAALNSRVIIEQAKGVLAERGDVDMNQAFNRLRQHARTHNSRLSDVARAVVQGTIDPSVLARAESDSGSWDSTPG